MDFRSDQRSLSPVLGGQPGLLSGAVLSLILRTVFNFELKFLSKLEIGLPIDLTTKLKS